MVMLMMLYRRHWTQREIRRGLDVLDMRGERELGNSSVVCRLVVLLRRIIALWLAVESLLGDGRLGEEEWGDHLRDMLNGLCVHKMGRIGRRRVWSSVWNGFICARGRVEHQVVRIAGRIRRRSGRRRLGQVIRRRWVVVVVSIDVFLRKPSILGLRVVMVVGIL